MKIHWLQHVPYEGLGNIEEWIINNKHELSCTRLFNNESLPNLADIDLLIIMGGSMGVYENENYPWLNDEIPFISQAIKKSKPILGICLGAQLIATALNAKVYEGSVKEIGWHPIKLYKPFEVPDEILAFPEDTPTVFHWHGDTFDLPKEAILLASTPEVTNQAFLYKNHVIGLQFHLEQTLETISQMIKEGEKEINEGGEKVQSALEIVRQTDDYLIENKMAMHNLLDYLSA